MAARKNNRRLIAREDGVAMITTMMVLVLVSALMVGFVTAIVADQRASGLDRDQTQAYAAAHAGLEQLTADLSGLFAADFTPSATDITTLTTTPPNVPNFTFVEPGGGSGYRIGFNADPNTGNPMAEATTGTTIAAGPYQGLRGIITPYDITVTARSRGGAEVRMRRTLQTVSMPVFQFGIFSEQDLGFHNSDGVDFQFGGRVHTNGSLYLTHCCSNGDRLTLPDRITSVNEVIRTHLMNGLDASTDYRGTVRVIKNTPNSYRNLATDEGSLVTNNFSVLNEPKWTALSVGTYASNIRNGRTGARRLELPLQTTGQNPIEIIRRPTAANEPTANAPLYNQRFYAQASLRILLSDTDTALTSLPEVTGLPVALGGTWNSSASTWGPDKLLDYGSTPADGMRSPIANSEDPTWPIGGTNYLPASVYRDRHNYPLIGGYIKIDLQKNDGTWIDVTREILGLGISGRNLADANASLTGTPAPRWNKVPDTTHTTQPPPAIGSGDICAEPHKDAVIRVQRVRDIPQTLAPCGIDTDVAGDITGNVSAVSQNEHDYWPLTLFDPREGYVRESTSFTASDVRLGGVVHYIELDANNLRRWLAGQIGSSGTQARNEDGKGFIVYFSDRRTNRNASGNETGEYGYEDVVNPGTAAGTPNGGTPDAGEDVNGNGSLDVYGGSAVNPTGASWISTNAPGDNVGGTYPALAARSNRPIFFRRALKVVNGGIFTTTGGAPNCSPAPCNNLPSPGLTIASENPVYVQGNFNATAASVTQEPNVAAAIIADAVTLLSNNWNDLRSFTSPHVASGRSASQTAFRMAVLAGKSLAFARPTGWTSMRDFGTDGGAHDFLRLIETWDTNQLAYSGSLVSFYASRQAVGTYKSGVTLAASQRNIFSVSNRALTFDIDFLAPSTLPPGTPSFRDVNTLTFRQLLRPTQ